MSKAKYSDEFKAQVVREIVERHRTIASVAASYDLVPQTVRNWVARYRKGNFGLEKREAVAEPAEIDRRAQGREPRAVSGQRVPEKSGRLLCAEAAVIDRYQIINHEEGTYPIATMCRWAGVSRSGYYSWHEREASSRATKKQRLEVVVRAEFEASDGVYGYRRIAAVLNRKGVSVSEDTVRAIMREQGLQAAQPRRKVRTTVTTDDLDERPDLVCRDFTAATPGTKWVGDITYIRTWAGFVYLATVLDCCTKKVVGWAMADHMRTDLVCEAIDMAVRRCPHRRGDTIFHSDRGSQYTSQQFSDHLKTYGVRLSTGRTGVCWDNAWAESFNATLKNERTHRMVYPTRKKAMDDIASWIELTYNQTRLHSALGYRTPNEVENEHLGRTQAA